MQYISQKSIIQIKVTNMENERSWNEQLETVFYVSFEETGGKCCIQIVTTSEA